MNEFESDWISLSQNQNGDRVLLIESQKENKVSESNMAECKMPGIIKLSQNEWVKLFLCKWREPILASVSEFEREN